MRHQSTRLRILAAATVLPVIGLAASTAPAHAQEGDGFEDHAGAAAFWLSSQADGPSWAAGDIGASLDATIGLMAAGVGRDQVEATLTWLNDPDILSSYVYPAGDESDDPALGLGAAGKVMYVVATAGGDPADFGGVKLADEAAQAPVEGLDAGTLSWGALGLSRTETGVSDELAAALVAAQCSDGGFSYTPAEDGDCSGDPDTTGLAAAALTAIGDAGAEARADAARWLVDHQGEDGGFDGGFGPNANSTAMAAQALLDSAEHAAAAEQAVAFLFGLQIGCGEDAAGAVKFSDPEDPDYGEASRLLATAQALVPLSGQTLATLDATGQSADIPAVECDDRETGQDGEATGDAGSDQDSVAWAPWVIVAGVVLLVAIVAFAIVRARRGGSGGDTSEA